MTRISILILAALLLAPRPSAETMPPVGDVRSSLAPLTGEVEPPQTTEAPAPTVAVSHPPQPAKAVSGIRSGVASWYCCTAGYGDCLCAAAGRALRAALGPRWRGRYVSVCRGAACIRVRLVDWMGNPKALIDLEPTAFARLALLSRGLITVTVRWR